MASWGAERSAGPGCHCFVCGAKLSSAGAVGACNPVGDPACNGGLSRDSSDDVSASGQDASERSAAGDLSNYYYFTGRAA